MQTQVFTITGTRKGKVKLPEGLFGQKPNLALLSQAVRVYRARERKGTASTKTRARVVASKSKLYRQKYTGRARHGSRSAPIFVGGGVAHGPKPRDFDLALPKKMRRKALVSALSAKMVEGSVLILDGGEKSKSKTKELALLFDKLKIADSKVLLVHAKEENLLRAARNLPNVEQVFCPDLNFYQVLQSGKLIFTTKALEVIKK